MTVPHNIYIHVPFCISKCKYCAFYSSAVSPDWDNYASKICAEIDHWATLMGRIGVPTIFFGGGTPSLMPPETFKRIINKISNSFCISNNCEITLEANPGTIDTKKLNEFCAIGANRLSIGVQSLKDDELDFLGRRHTAKEALNLIEAAQHKGIRTSADFIYGLPGQSYGDIIQMCHDINSIGLNHCSMYELTIETGTPFAKMNLEMPSNNDMAKMYIAIDKNLNLPRYEISNYAIAGDECRHNQNIWDGDAYIGIGRGAAGRVYIDDTWYEQLGAGGAFEKMPTNIRATEKIITGMRTKRGTLLTPDVRAVIDLEWAMAHTELVKISGNRIAATNTGMLTLDNILLDLVR